MLNVIEVRPQVNVNDTRLALHNCLCHSVYRLMRCPFRPVSIRPRLEISFEDRLQDELDGPLDHTITDSRKRKNAAFCPVFRNLLLPRPPGPIRACGEFVPDPPQKTLHSAFLDGLERDSVYTRCPVVLLRHPVGFVERFHLANVDVQPPETPSWFSLRLDV